MIAAVAVVGRPERQKRHQRSGGGGVVRGLGPATPSMAPWPNSSGRLVMSLFGAIGQEAGNVRTACRHGADGKTDGGAAQPGFQDRRQSSRVMATEPLMAWTFSCIAAAWAATNSASPTANMATASVVTSIPSRSCGTPKDSRAWPVSPSIPTSRQRKTDEQRRQPLHRAFAKGGRHGDKGQTPSGQSTRAGRRTSASLTICGARNASASVASRPATNDPMAAVASAGPSTARRGPSCCPRAP